jgi:hypothetical protein
MPMAGTAPAATLVGGLNVANSGGALVAVDSGRMAMIAPLSNPQHNDDSSSDDDIVDGDDVTPRRHHRHHHHGHKLNGAVQEGFEGDAEGLGFNKGPAKLYDLEQGGGAAAAGWQQQQWGVAAAAPTAATGSYDSDGPGSCYPPMAGGLRQPYEQGEGL